MKGYVWEDKNDPHATGVPDLGLIHKTKKDALRDFGKYAAEMDIPWAPKIRLWRIKSERVKV